MRTRLVSRACGSWGEEDGFALLIVMGMAAVLTVMALSGFYLAQQANHDASRVLEESKAFQAANAGIDAAVARLTTHGFQTGDYPISLTTADLSSGSATVTLAPIDAYEFRATSQGQDAGGTTETVTVQIFYLNLYSMNISSLGNPTSGAALKGNSSIYGPFYARGTMDLSSNTSMEKGPLFLKNGNIALGGSGTVGTASMPIIVYCDGTVPNTGTKGWHVSKLNRTVPLITLPAVDAAYLATCYNKSKTESTDNIMGDGSSPNAESTWGSYSTWNGVANSRTASPGASTSYYKYIGPSGGPSTSGNGSTNVTIDSGTASFGKFGYDASNPTVSGTAHDDFALDMSTSPATLYVNGTVFIDGDLTITVPIQYKGNGAIICNGDISVNQFKPAGGLLSDGTNPNQNFPADKCVGLASPTVIHLNGGGGNANKDFTSEPDIAAALFCSHSITLDNNLVFAGSLIAATIEGPTTGNNPHIRPSPNLTDVLSDSMPGRNNYLTTIAAWSRR